MWSMRTQTRQARLLGGEGDGRGGDGRRRHPKPARPSRGLDGLADSITDRLSGLGYAPSSFDVALGVGALIVIGAAFVVPALTKKRAS